MNTQHNIPFFFQYIPPVLFVVFILLFFGKALLRIVKAGGLKAALFGAPIVRTVGEVTVSGPRSMKRVIRVHVLGGATEGREIGLELVSSGQRTYRMMPVPMSRLDAQQLISLLQMASHG